MNTAAQHRLELAATVAAQLAAEHPDCEVWLEGPLALGLAHARSDVDLRLITSDGTRVEAWSQVTAGVRIDVDVSTRDQQHASDVLLNEMSVTFDDISVFRTVRKHIGALTRLRTAHRLVDNTWSPVLAPDRVAIYQQWALADRAEHIASLTEDLVGLIAEGMWQNTEVVWIQLQFALASADAVSRGHPMLGDKWMPSLLPSHCIQDSIPPPEPGGDPHEWSAPLQLRLLEALRRLWPAEPPAGTAAPVAKPAAGWMPQRYADGWFVRLGDDRKQLSPSEIESWHMLLCHKLREGTDDARDDSHKRAE